MDNMEKLLMIYGSIVYVHLQCLYNEEMKSDKMAASLETQIELVSKQLELYDSRDILLFGQKKLAELVSGVLTALTESREGVH